MKGKRVVVDFTSERTREREICFNEPTIRLLINQPVDQPYQFSDRIRKYRFHCVIQTAIGMMLVKVVEAERGTSETRLDSGLS